MVRFFIELNLGRFNQVKICFSFHFSLLLVTKSAMRLTHLLNAAGFILQGFVMNLQPSEAEAGFDIRVPPNTDPVALERRIAEEWAPSSRNMTFEVWTARRVL